MSLLDRDDVCIRPWEAVMVGPTGANLCCHAKVAMTEWPEWGGVYAGAASWWQEGAFLQARQKMAAGGISLACPGARCDFALKPTTPREQIAMLKRQFGDNARTQALEACLDGDPYTDVPPPLAANVSLGVACNLSCSFCVQAGIRAGATRQEPTAEELAALAGFCSGCRSIYVSGGDPFALPAETLYAFFGSLPEEEGREVVAVTNGVGLTPQAYQRWVANGPITTVLVSLDTVDPEAYRAMRGTSVTTVLSNLETITVSTHRIKRLLSVFTLATGPHLPELVAYAEARGIPEVEVSPLLTGYGNPIPADLDPADKGADPALVRQAAAGLVEAEFSGSSKVRILGAQRTLACLRKARGATL